MLALTVKQPFAHLIIAGHKTVENRSWETAYRGKLYLHAGKSREVTREIIRQEYTWKELFQVEEPPPQALHFGAILGTVTLVDCVPLEKLKGKAHKKWAEGPWCWVLEEVERWEQPVSCNGALGLWKPKSTIILPTV